MDKIRNLEEQYDKIYRYCYFKVRHRETAEDLTQETFLRFWQSTRYQDTGKAIQYLYTIARNLCIDEYRKPHPLFLGQYEEYGAFCNTPANKGESPLLRPSGKMRAEQETENAILNRLTVKSALAELEEKEQELLLLRYANEVPISGLCGFYGISRFALRRQLLQAKKHLKEILGKEEF